MACTLVSLTYIGTTTDCFVTSNPTNYYFSGVGLAVGAQLYTDAGCSLGNEALEGYYAYDGGPTRLIARVQATIKAKSLITELSSCYNCVLGFVNGIDVDYSYYDCCGNYISGTTTGILLKISNIDWSKPYSPTITLGQPTLPITPYCVSQTPTQTPTPTPTPTLYSKSIYVSSCCDGKVYYLQSNIPQNVGSIIRVAPTNFCYTVILKPSYPVTSVVNDALGVFTVSDCFNVSCQSCPTPLPTQTPNSTPPPSGVIIPPVPAAGSTGSECKIITIQNLGIECIGTNPTSYSSYDGSLTVTATGGTAPYYYVWRAPDGSVYYTKTINSLPSGDYTVTVYDYWRDFTATTTCSIIGPKDCTFEGSYSEFVPTEVATCGILIANAADGGVYFYDLFTNTSVLLDVPNSGVSSDIAHTLNKLWLVSGFTGWNEWNITLSPFSAVYSRYIPYPPLYTASNGLAAINDTTLVAVNTSTTPITVVEIDLSGPSAQMTTKFQLGTNRRVTGDFFLTTNNKFIVTLTNIIDGTNYIAQYDYLTHNLELEITLDPSITSAYGVFEDNGEIYIGRGTTSGEIYKVDKTYPYSTTFINNSNNYIAGASQIPSCLTEGFVTAGIPTTPSATPNSTPPASGGSSPSPSTSPTQTPTPTPTQTTAGSGSVTITVDAPGLFPYPVSAGNGSSSGTISNNLGSTIYVYIVFNSGGNNSGDIGADSGTVNGTSLPMTGTISSSGQYIYSASYVALNNGDINIPWDLSKQDNLTSGATLRLGYSTSPGGTITYIN